MPVSIDNTYHANLTLFADELARIPRLEDMLVLLDRFAQILSPDDAHKLVALVQLAARPAPEDEDDEDEDDDSDDEEDAE